MPDVFDLRPEPSGKLARRIVDLVWPSFERLLGIDQVRGIYAQRPEGCRGFDLMDASLRALDMRYDVDDGDLARVPARGPVVVVANHPFGGTEGLVLGSLLRSRRNDVRILANRYLCRVPELNEICLPVDPFAASGATGGSLSGLRRARRWLAAGGMLVVFPAGEVAHYRLGNRRIEDPPWHPTVARLVRQARCPVVPVFFDGRNRRRFQLLGLIHPRLRTALLARELLARRGQTIEVRIGSPIPLAQLETCADDRSLLDYLRSRTFILSERPASSERPVQPRVTPRMADPVVLGEPTELLVEELERLPSRQLLVDGSDQVVYYAAADQIPKLLREIGRLREISFREVGEGTGREIDLDVYDETYLHLFVWSRKNRELVGAYRLGLTDELIRTRGTAGLYTSTLFHFKPRLFDEMGPAIEMGRSFIRPEYQKSYQGLLLLWKGIGQFVVQHPRYATLFGPVSISADYRSASQRLIVAFLEQNNYAHSWARWVRPQVPTRVDRAPSYRPSPAQLRDLDEVSSFIAEIEADHKGVPILLKQYLRLGGRLLGFNVDPDFSNVLDVLIMVDLRRTRRKTLERYMGREGTSRFLAHTSDSHSRAS